MGLLRPDAGRSAEPLTSEADASAAASAARDFAEPVAHSGRALRPQRCCFCFERMLAYHPRSSPLGRLRSLTVPAARP
eukprot:1375189-Alexandrium_andersonii.AAC.1